MYSGHNVYRNVGEEILSRVNSQKLKAPKQTQLFKIRLLENMHIAKPSNALKAMKDCIILVICDRMSVLHIFGHNYFFLPKTDLSPTLLINFKELEFSYKN